MPWNNSIENEYMAMLDGNIGDALDLPNDFFLPPYLAKIIIISNCEKLEKGRAQDLVISPDNNEYLSYWEIRLLHLMRAACNMFAERTGIFPWKLADKSVNELRHLLSLTYQYSHHSSSSGYQFHRVWDTSPGPRIEEALTAYTFLVLFAAFGLVDSVPTSETDMICFIVQNMRDSGWGHMSGWYDNYDNYPNHGYPVWDYTIVSEVKRTGCHMMSDYLTGLLRTYNIIANIGYDPFHTFRHCYIDFRSINKWFSHGDDVYSARFKAIPVEFAFKSDSWMSNNAFNATGYEWTTACSFESAFWWCFLLGRSNINSYDVRYLYHNDQLRNTLETIHEGTDWTQFEHPDPIPPVFDDDMVDFLMAWVEFKIEREDNP